MAERHTSISLPGNVDAGMADHGRKTPAEMIALYREWAKHNKKWADAVLSASDEDFSVETYTGVHVRRNREVLQSPVGFERLHELKKDGVICRDTGFWPIEDQRCTGCDDDIRPLLAYSELSHIVNPLVGRIRQAPHDEAFEAVAEAATKATKAVAEILGRPELALQMARNVFPVLKSKVMEILDSDTEGVAMPMFALTPTYRAMAWSCVRTVNAAS